MCFEPAQRRRTTKVPIGGNRALERPSPCRYCDCRTSGSHHQQYEERRDQCTGLRKRREFVQQDLLHTRKPRMGQSVPAPEDDGHATGTNRRRQGRLPRLAIQSLSGVQSRSSSLLRSGSGAHGLMVRSLSRTGLPSVLSTKPASSAFFSASFSVGKVRLNFWSSLNTA